MANTCRCFTAVLRLHTHRQSRSPQNTKSTAWPTQIWNGIYIATACAITNPLSAWGHMLLSLAHMGQLYRCSVQVQCHTRFLWGVLCVWGGGGGDVSTTTHARLNVNCTWASAPNQMSDPGVLKRVATCVLNMSGSQRWQKWEHFCGRWKKKDAAQSRSTHWTASLKSKLKKRFQYGCNIMWFWSHKNVCEDISLGTASTSKMLSAVVIFLYYIFPFFLFSNILILLIFFLINT